MQITLLIKTEGADATGAALKRPLSFRGAAFLL